MKKVYTKEASRSRRSRCPRPRGRVAGFEASGETATLRVVWPVGELLAALREGLSSLAVEGGLLIAQALLADEVEQRVGPRHARRPERTASRWGWEEGFVVLAGRKVPLRRPRVRDTAGREVVLERYGQLQSPGRLGEEVARRMLCGVSTRDYAKAVETFCEGYGIEKSSVSRHWKAASAKRLRELVERPLGDLDLAVIFVDGIRFQGYLFVVALGVDTGGRKHILGLWEGATENATVCKMLLGDLVSRGLRTDRRYLWVLDGSKALRKGVEAVFGADVVVHRCHAHKERNVLDHLPKKHRARVRVKLRAAWGMKDYAEARAALRNVVAHLRTLSEGAAKSLEEGLEETLTLHRLGVSDPLRRSLRTTNTIENTFSLTRRGCRNVKRWRNGAMAWRWAGTVLLDVEKRFHRIKGYRDLGSLLRALGRGPSDSTALAPGKEVA